METVELFQNIITIINKPFCREIIANKGEIYFVGGYVRDNLMGKQPKDIDLACRLLPFNILSDILSKYGKVDLVGESFGVIKFKEFETDFECEIAITRKDSLDQEKKGHKAIIAQSDEMIAIEDDLKRRDFTMNSIAVSHHLQIIDPFGGLKDLEHKIIRATDDQAFVEDPLRMLRALQFSARFYFSIDNKTFALIKSHASLIRDISGERVLMEFQKVVDKKGDHIIFLELLDKTGLWEQFFDFKMSNKIEKHISTTLSELLYTTINDDFVESTFLWSEIFGKRIKIDIKTQKELNALQNIEKIKSIHPYESYNNDIGRRLIFNCLRLCPWALDLPLFHLNGVEQDFISGKYPKSFKELKISGDDLIEMGFKEGKEIGGILMQILDKVLRDELKNDREELMDHIKLNLCR